MPSLSMARRIHNATTNNAKTVGQIHKQNSDFAMEYLWDNDIQSKQCYIYDYLHDDQPELNSGMTYEGTTKTPIAAKIIVSTYGSISKDQPTLLCQFKPSQKEYFGEDDNLYYLEEYRKKYGLEDIFVGCYLDIPDKNGIYHKHMICLKDVDQNFQKYFILPCDHKLQWIHVKGNKRYKRNMWCVLRSQSSYSSGIWNDQNFSVQQNQETLFIPTNAISDTIYYVSEGNNKNQRIILDSPNYSIDNWTPNTWIVSKVERVNVKGRTKLTLYQTAFNSDTDYIEYDANGYIVGMYADYFESSLPPEDTDTSTTDTKIIAKISASTSTIQVGGSYKTFTANIFNMLDDDITSTYSDATFTWSCEVGETDLTEQVLWRQSSNFNSIMLKFSDNRSYIGRLLVVECVITKDNTTLNSSTQLQIIG